jgi:hypothetical protein
MTLAYLSRLRLARKSVTIGIRTPTWCRNPPRRGVGEGLNQPIPHGRLPDTKLLVLRPREVDALTQGRVCIEMTWSFIRRDKFSVSRKKPNAVNKEIVTPCRYSWRFEMNFPMRGNRTRNKHDRLVIGVILPRPRSPLSRYSGLQKLRALPLLWFFGIANVPGIKCHRHLHGVIGVHPERVFKIGPIRF